MLLNIYWFCACFSALMFVSFFCTHRGFRSTSLRAPPRHEKPYCHRIDLSASSVTCQITITEENCTRYQVTLRNRNLLLPSLGRLVVMEISRKIKVNNLSGKIIDFPSGIFHVFNFLTPASIPENHLELL